MSGCGFSRDDLVRRGETMNRLKEQRRALNMRLRLAMQTHDEALRADLEAQLYEVTAQISCLGSCVHVPPQR